jgi:oligosaccharyltransferase complex subunit delta (ribophorin II)
MRFSIATTLALLAASANAASTWGFKNGAVTPRSKAAPGSAVAFSDKKRAEGLVLGGETEVIDVSIDITEGSKAKVPHQAFLVLREASGLEVPYPLTVESSKATGKVSITQKDLPVQFLLSEKPLQASIVLGSFGSSAASSTPVFDLSVELDTSVAPPKYEAPLRYGKLPEIHHIFRPDPKSPPKIISIVFALAVVAAVPALFVGWLATGANVSHLSTAMNGAPVSHALFFGSIIAMEGVFFMYYSSWTLFQTLPIAGVVGTTAFLSGSKALGEVQRRRLAGQR